MAFFHPSRLIALKYENNEFHKREKHNRSVAKQLIAIHDFRERSQASINYYLSLNMYRARE